MKKIPEYLTPATIQHKFAIHATRATRGEVYSHVEQAIGRISIEGQHVALNDPRVRV